MAECGCSVPGAQSWGGHSGVCRDGGCALRCGRGVSLFGGVRPCAEGTCSSPVRCASVCDGCDGERGLAGCGAETGVRVCGGLEKALRGRARASAWASSRGLGEGRSSWPLLQVVWCQLSPHRTHTHGPSRDCPECPGSPAHARAAPRSAGKVVLAAAPSLRQLARWASPQAPGAVRAPPSRAPLGVRPGLACPGVPPTLRDPGLCRVGSRGPR